ncbi:hypothetical protein JRQ81_019052, partial [Phrynocephalus forsythii]
PTRSLSPISSFHRNIWKLPCGCSAFLPLLHWLQRVNLEAATVWRCADAGIPSRRQNRPKASFTPAELPEKETKRIARIFSSQFSKKT